MCVCPMSCRPAVLLASAARRTLLKHDYRRIDAGRVRVASVTPLFVLRRWFQLDRRPNKSMTAAQVSSALAPFYFAVHPDLFAKYPTERLVNENSLKLLNAFLECGENRSGSGLVLPFFLLRKNAVGSLTAVEIRLTAGGDVRRAVKTILETCRLTTDGVDKLPSSSSTVTSTSSVHGVELGLGRFGQRIRYEPPPFNYDVDGPELEEDDVLTRHKTVEVTMNTWLRESADVARVRAAAVEKTLAEAEGLRADLVRTLGLADICWNRDWSAIYRRAILLSFKALHRDHPDEVAGHLAGVRVIFGSETGLTRNGDLLLNSGEVRNNWLKMITRMKEHWTTLSRIPAVEQAVSRSLMDIQVVHRRFQPTILAEDYELNLRQLVTSIGDYRGRMGFPKHWPEKLSQLQLVVESAAGPLTLTPSGQFVTPSSCPASLLVRFLDDNMHESVRLLQVYARDSVLEKQVEDECRSSLAMKSLQKDNHVSPDQMISFCRRLLDPRQRHLARYWKDANVYVSTYHSISDDGTIYVPWNFK